MQSFYTDVITKSPLFRSPNRVSTVDLLEPVTRAAVQAIVADAAAMGFPCVVFETYRSQQRQSDLFDRGATQLQKVGVHHYGLAADIVRLISNQPNWNVSYDFMGPLAKKHGLVWGGDWVGFRDMVHVQRISVRDQPQLFAGSFYPDEHYAVV